MVLKNVCTLKVFFRQILGLGIHGTTFGEVSVECGDFGLHWFMIFLGKPRWSEFALPKHVATWGGKWYSERANLVLYELYMDLCCATADPRKIQKDDKLVFNKLPNEPKNGMPPDRNPHLHSTYHVLTSLVPEACALSPFSLRELNLRESTKLGTFQPLSRISLKKLAINPCCKLQTCQERDVQFQS